jgi:hypothetical protein
MVDFYGNATGNTSSFRQPRVSAPQALPACPNVMMMMQLFAAQDALANEMPMRLAGVMLGASVGRDVVDAGHTTVRQETAALRDFSPSMSGLGSSPQLCEPMLEHGHRRSLHHAAMCI